MRGTRSFRYGARFTVTAPLAAVFTVVAAEMVMLAVPATTTWRIVFVGVGSIAALLAIAMLREVVARIRGKRRIVVATRELVMPEGGGTVRFRDIQGLELKGAGFQRVLEIRHANGTLEISGVMLGSVGELDEIHGLIKAARKSR
ncbi:MAG: hypothetical protein ABJE66_04395 [Deltaproteobacteria bacterium]